MLSDDMKQRVRTMTTCLLYIVYFYELGYIAGYFSEAVNKKYTGCKLKFNIGVTHVLSSVFYACVCSAFCFLQ